MAMCANYIIFIPWWALLLLSNSVTILPHSHRNKVFGSRSPSSWTLLLLLFSSIFYWILSFTTFDCNHTLAIRVVLFDLDLLLTSTHTHSTFSSNFVFLIIFCSPSIALAAWFSNQLTYVRREIALGNDQIFIRLICVGCNVCVLQILFIFQLIFRGFICSRCLIGRAEQVSTANEQSYLQPNQRFIHSLCRVKPIYSQIMITQYRADDHGQHTHKKRVQFCTALMAIVSDRKKSLKSRIYFDRISNFFPPRIDFACQCKYFTNNLLT